MAGRVICTILSLIAGVHISCFIVFFFLHQDVRNAVNNLNYDACEIVSTSGMLSGKTYQFLKEQTAKLGEYDIGLKLERQIKPGIYNTYYSIDDIVEKLLEKGDRLTISIRSLDMSLFDRLVSASFLPFGTAAGDRLGIYSVKTAFVSGQGRKYIKGYEIIDSINNGVFWPSAAVLVVTAANTHGKHYGLDTHDDVAVTNTSYGDSSDEMNGGVNHISPTGNFSVEKKLDAAGNLSFIKYIQK